MQVHVDKHGSINSVFKFTCHGMVGATHLIMERGKVNTPMADVCKGGPIRVAYQNLPGIFWVLEDNEMFQYQNDGGYLNHMTFPHEILTSFFIANQLSPTFLDNPNLVSRYFFFTLYFV